MILAASSVQSDLQLRIEAKRDIVRVSIKNNGPVTRWLPAGNLKITAERGAETQLVFDVNALQQEHPGFVANTVGVRLEPGQEHVTTLPVTQLLCVVNRHDVPLGRLLEQGYTLRASFEIDGVTLTTGP